MDLSNIDISKLSFSEKFFLKCISDGVKVRESLEVMTQDPMKYNKDLLMKILEDNKETEYGQKYDFANIKSPVPINARTGVKEVGFNNCINKLSLEIPPKLRSHAVTVVPIFAPMITVIDCFKVIIPEFTKPTTITVVAEEL